MTIDDLIKQDFKVFIPFDMSKADKTQHMVYGLATTDHLDSQGEIITKEAVLKAWPAYAAFGNIREMHTNKAAGKLKNTVWKNGSPYIGAKIVDKEAWTKVTEEVYMGWSIGGKKIHKIGNEVDEVEINEISLVDRPANPEALFDLYKADIHGAENALMEKQANQSNFEIQDLLFPIAKFTSAEARKWAEDHNFQSDKVDTEGLFHKVQQLDPELCVVGSSKSFNLDVDAGIQATSCSKKEVKKGEDMKIELVEAGPILKKFVGAIATMPGYTEDLKKNFWTMKDLIGALDTMIFLTKEVKMEEGQSGKPGEGTEEQFLAATAKIADLAIQYNAAQITAAMENLAGVKPKSLLISGEEEKAAMDKVKELEEAGAKISKTSADTLTDLMGQMKTFVAKTQEGKKNMKKFTDEETKNAEDFGKLSDTEKADLQKSDGPRYKVLEAAHELVNAKEEPEPLAKAEEIAKIEDLGKRVDAIKGKIGEALDANGKLMTKLEESGKAKDEALAKVETLSKEVLDLKKSNEDLTQSNTAMRKQVGVPNVNAAPHFIGKDKDSGNKEIDALAKQQIIAQTKGDVNTIIGMTRDGTLRKDLTGKTYSKDQMAKFEGELNE